MSGGQYPRFALRVRVYKKRRRLLPVTLDAKITCYKFLPIQDHTFELNGHRFLE